MELIDKDAVVAEMKRRIFNLEQLGDRNFIETHFTEQFSYDVDKTIETFIERIKCQEKPSDEVGINGFNRLRR